MHSPQDSIAPTPSLFSDIYEKRKTTPPSKKILYIGRYLEVKGVRELWAAFMELSDEFPEWELHCIGTVNFGTAEPFIPKSSTTDSSSLHELEPLLEDASCFVMPSKKEPWGVVLHEMAIAGLPLLAARNVGASSQFLESKNGIILRQAIEGSTAINFLRKRQELCERWESKRVTNWNKHMPEN